MEIKKLIEVALPLEKINAESAREKSIRHGHPSTLHLWWARRPLAAARAVIWSSLVDDPSSHPELFPTEEDQNQERERLFRILEDLVVWENSNNEEVLEKARAEILKYTDGHPPALLDPFAGGGSIPLEAQRLGLEAHAHDLNPVAVMINKAMIEIPPRFANMPPVNPEARAQMSPSTGWKGAAGLAEDVRYYGEWMKQEAFKRIGHLYPQVKVPPEQGGGEATVIAWIWVRTVKCPNPACGCTAPLAHSFVLSSKKGNPAWIEPVIQGNNVIYSVHRSGSPVIKETVTRKGAVCIHCKSKISFPYIRDEGKHGRMESDLCAIVAEGKRERIYLPADTIHKNAAIVPRPSSYPDAVLPNNPRDFKTPNYGILNFADLFTNRQLIALTTFSDLVVKAQKKIQEDALLAISSGDVNSLCNGGHGALAYSEAISVYLSFIVDKLADLCNSLNRWEPNAQCPRQLFARQAIPMVWDHAEANPFSKSSGSWFILLRNLTRCLENNLFNFDRIALGYAEQFDAQASCNLQNIMISTDPPYYDNIGYADLSDFFYIWMRQSLKRSYPKLFETLLVPKTEELVATPYRFNGSTEHAKKFFESGMISACKQMYSYSRVDIPVTIYYAYKQSNSAESAVSSSGWETMLSAIIHAGFSITGTWPMNTECSSRSVAQGANALASSIVLVCRKRTGSAPVCPRRKFVAELRRELHPALKKLQISNIAPVDLAQSAIGPGMAIFSRYSKVIEADGTPMSVRTALQIINQELDLFFNDQDGALDSASRFCVDLYTQYAFNDVKFGEADTLARAKNISVDSIASLKILYAQKGIAHLHERKDLPKEINTREPCTWLLTQQLAYAMEKGGVQACAEVLVKVSGYLSEQAKSLAYRLYQIADRKKWTQEAYAYNSLVTSWAEIQERVSSLKSELQFAPENDAQTTISGF